MMMQISPEEMIAMMKQAKMMSDEQIEQAVMMKAQAQETPGRAPGMIERGNKGLQSLASDMSQNVAAMRKSKGRMM